MLVDGRRRAVSRSRMKGGAGAIRDGARASEECNIRAPSAASHQHLCIARPARPLRELSIPRARRAHHRASWIYFFPFQALALRSPLLDLPLATSLSLPSHLPPCLCRPHSRKRSSPSSSPPSGPSCSGSSLARRECRLSLAVAGSNSPIDAPRPLGSSA